MGYVCAKPKSMEHIMLTQGCSELRAKKIIEDCIRNTRVGEGDGLKAQDQDADQAARAVA